MKMTLTIAIKAIMTNKSRSILTTLGVVIGVGSVVMLTSIGHGLSASITEAFDDLGANTVIVFPGDILSEGSGFSEDSFVSLATSKLRLSHVQELRRQREHVSQAVPFNMQSDRLNFLGNSKFTTIMGTTWEFEQAFNLKPEKGRFFNRAEDDEGRRVVVLGHTLAEEIFGSVDPIGKRVRLGNQAFTVVGVIEKQGGGFGGPSFDAYAFIPLRTAFKLYDNQTIVRIIVKIKDVERLEESMAVIEKTLSRTLKDDDFSIYDQSELLRTITQILGVLTVGLGGIASISLLVGGIGIMNIMLVSVTERTREIGLRKALGATPNTILWQFLIEAAVLSLLGGVIGVSLAFLGTLAIQAFMPAKVTLNAVLLAFGVSTAVGLIFGAAPARRAAKLSPIEALRYE
jgi:putative ABC transport system permease protein